MKGKTAYKIDPIVLDTTWEDPFPVNGQRPAKRKFLPSVSERKKINKIVDGIKKGTIKTLEQKQEESKVKPEKFEDLWNKQQEQIRNIIQAPKLALPQHNESYNPPAEYLLDEEEKIEWEKTDKEDRETNFLPRKYEKLRHVEQYSNLIEERFERLLDLYLCPRVKKQKLQMTSDQLLPQIPKPKDLRPFPTKLNIQYIGHTSRVRAISVTQNGQFLASAGENGDLIVFDVITSRIVYQHKFESTIFSLQFNNKNLLAIITGEEIHLIILPIFTRYIKNELEKIIQGSVVQSQLNTSILKWEVVEESFLYKKGFRILIKSEEDLKSIVFHQKGDYFATTSPQSQNKGLQCIVHCISKGMSSSPFNKQKGDVQKVMFHNKKPFIFILTKRHCIILNLQKQAKVKTLLTGTQYNSCLDLHSQGDNLIIGSFDQKLLWFDLDLSDKPYKVMKYHDKAIRNVTFSNKFPLFASCSDDGSIGIYHAKVFSDLSQNAMVLPLKTLKGHKIQENIGVLDIKFHPLNPWVFSCGGDHQIYLWT